MQHRNETSVTKSLGIAMTVALQHAHCVKRCYKTLMMCFGKVLVEQGSRTRRVGITTKLNCDIPSSLDFQ